MAVHAAMAGKTGALIGYHHNTFVHVPVDVAVESRRRMDPTGDLWNAVLGCTGQPRW
jgi:6-phosphofructokinase 1